MRREGSDNSRAKQWTQLRGQRRVSDLGEEKGQRRVSDLGDGGRGVEWRGHGGKANHKIQLPVLFCLFCCLTLFEHSQTMHSGRGAVGTSGGDA